MTPALTTQKPKRKQLSITNSNANDRTLSKDFHLTNDILKNNDNINNLNIYGGDNNIDGSAGERNLHNGVYNNSDGK